MPQRQSIRSILGKPRISKPRSSSSGTNSPSASRSPLKPRPKAERRSSRHDDDASLLFPDRFPDLGALSALTVHEELSLRDVVQAMRYVRSHMFSSVPLVSGESGARGGGGGRASSGGGLSSTRTAEVLNYRASIAPVVSTGHVRAVLDKMAPSQVERETNELVTRGVLRRVRIERRGEGLVETERLEEMLARQRPLGVSARSRAAFTRLLRGRPTAQIIEDGDLLGEGEGAEGDRERDGAEEDQGQRVTRMLDELVRAGFLTSVNATTAASLGDNNTLQIRPEDRTTLTSIQHVARFASGTVSAVGGQNAIHLAGGGGGGGGKGNGDATSRRRRDDPGRGSGGGGMYRIAVPGHGRCLKLADDAVAWVRDVLGKTKWGEGPESWLRERFEGRGFYGTRWKDFWGLEWDWVLGEAVGVGAVEVFDTGSVGKGVRAVGGPW